MRFTRFPWDWLAKYARRWKSCEEGYTYVWLLTGPYLLHRLVGPAGALEIADRLLLREVLLPLGRASSTEPRASLVANKIVVDKGVVAELMPAKVTAVAEDNLIPGQAQASRAHLAERLLGRAFAVVLSLRGARDGSRIELRWFGYLATRLSHGMRDLVVGAIALAFGPVTTPGRDRVVASLPTLGPFRCTPAPLRGNLDRVPQGCCFGRPQGPCQLGVGAVAHEAHWCRGRARPRCNGGGQRHGERSTHVHALGKTSLGILVSGLLEGARGRRRRDGLVVVARLPADLLENHLGAG